MKHVRMLAPLALAAALVAPLAVAGPASATAKREARTTESATAKRAGYRQFTGTVIAVDGSTITVAKAGKGKTSKQMVFSRAATLRPGDDLGKDSRVTVFWREESGKPVAHRVVTRPTTAGSR
ncbi:MAG: hypothetical protein RL721_1831 [Candidatus Eisenbacteria bacterium]|jgi:hypothetical protein